LRVDAFPHKSQPLIFTNIFLFIMLLDLHPCFGLILGRFGVVNRITSASYEINQVSEALLNNPFRSIFEGFGELLSEEAELSID